MRTMTVRNQNALPTKPTRPTAADTRRLNAMLEAEEQYEQGGEGLRGSITENGYTAVVEFRWLSDGVHAFLLATRLPGQELQRVGPGPAGALIV